MFIPNADTRKGVHDRGDGLGSATNRRSRRCRWHPRRNGRGELDTATDNARPTPFRTMISTETDEDLSGGVGVARDVDTGGRCAPANVNLGVDHQPILPGRQIGEPACRGGIEPPCAATELWVVRSAEEDRVGWHAATTKVTDVVLTPLRIALWDRDRQREPRRAGSATAPLRCREPSTHPSGSPAPRAGGHRSLDRHRGRFPLNRLIMTFFLGQRHAADWSLRASMWSSLIHLFS